MNVLATIRHAVEWVALGIELLAVAVIVGGVVRVVVSHGTLRYLLHLQEHGAVEDYKQQLGKPVLLGLLLGVAGDAIGTVAVQPTLTNVAVLGLLVVVRTLLSWSLYVEMEGRWPWSGSSRGAS